MQAELDNRIADMKDRILETCSRLDGGPGEVCAAALLAALEILAEPFRKSASPAERRLIKSHYPDATDETINAYRLNRKGIMNVIEFTTTAARKYLDHQPETTGILDGTRSPEVLKGLVPAISRGIRAVSTRTES